jgi:hypothetical protein
MGKCRNESYNFKTKLLLLKQTMKGKTMTKKLTIKKWLLKEQLKGTLLIKDIAQNGCSGGVYGLTMYYETSEFYNQHQEEIWDELNYYAMEYKSVMDMLADTNIGKYIVDDTTFKNSVVWFVVECIANRIEDESVKVA